MKTRSGTRAWAEQNARFMAELTRERKPISKALVEYVSGGFLARDPRCQVMMIFEGPAWRQLPGPEKTA